MSTCYCRLKKLIIYLWVKKPSAPVLGTLSQVIVGNELEVFIPDMNVHEECSLVIQVSMEGMGC